VFACLLSLATSARWAVLYIGSNSFSNYRHHSNIDTAYKVLIDRGFDKSHIVLCQYNDIPNHPSNPFKGQLFHSLDHKNIYAGQDAISFTQKEVNAQLFYDIVSGKKALKSTSEDDVYIYYDNHGGPGILGVPDGTGDYIKADLLGKAFAELEQKNMYKHLFFMIGACYSFSMTKTIKNRNMAIITSANDHESAYACTYDSAVGAYLTNEFSLNFDLLVRSRPDITIGEFFDSMKKAVQKSEICFAGDESMKSLKINVFIGDADRPQVVDALPARDFADPKEATLRHIVDNHHLYKTRTAEMETTTRRFREIASKFGRNSFELNGEIQYEQYFEVVRHFEKRFGAVHPDDLGEYQLFANLCNFYGVEEIKAAIDSTN